MSATWHVDGPTWGAYAEGRLDAAAEAAVETHVTACPDCQGAARTLVADPAPVWAAVHAEISRPRLPAPMRWLTRLGVPEADLVVLVSARDLPFAWVVAVGAAVLCACLTGLAPVHLPGGPSSLFLVLAPLVPVLAVVATYDATDPFREVTEASPFSALRLALLRTTGAPVPAVPLTVLVSLVVPGVRGYFAAWLLPGLALTVLALILLTWCTAWVASGLVGAGWVLVAGVAAGHGGIATVGTAAGQLASALVLVGLAAVLVRVGTAQHTRGVAR